MKQITHDSFIIRYIQGGKIQYYSLSLSFNDQHL